MCRVPVTHALTKWTSFSLTHPGALHLQLSLLPHESLLFFSTLTAYGHCKYCSPLKWSKHKINQSPASQLSLSSLYHKSYFKTYFTFHALTCISFSIQPIQTRILSKYHILDPKSIFLINLKILFLFSFI